MLVIIIIIIIIIIIVNASLPHEGLFNANIYKTDALKWLCYWSMLCMSEHISQSEDGPNFKFASILMSFSRSPASGWAM